MKIGFISLSVPGHFHPMSAVARQLASRNHDIVVLSLPAMEPFARAANLPFIPFGQKEFPAEHTAEVVGTLSRLKGEEALQFTVGAVAWVLKVKWRELPKLLSANGIDALVLDDYEGVPQVAIPVTNDQPGVAARIAAHQIGVVAPLETLTVSHLITLVDEVLNNSMYRDNAPKYQRSIAETNGLSRAASLLEEAFGSPKKKQLIHFNRGESNGQRNRERAPGI